VLGLNEILELLKGKNKPQLAQIIAFILGPGLIFVISVFLIFGSSMSFEKPAAISELKTEIDQNGNRIPKQGVVLITELSPSHLVLPIENSSTFWSSLDNDAVHEKLLSGNLKLDAGQFLSKAPLGDEAVIVVVNGKIGSEIFVSGVKEPLDDWRLTSNESRSLISGASAVWLLAFGMAFALGTSPVKSEQEDAGEVRAEPNEN
jgi:hypothetical protein